jgi:hypothetical protein
MTLLTELGNYSLVIYKYFAPTALMTPLYEYIARAHQLPLLRHSHQSPLLRVLSVQNVLNPSNSGNVSSSISDPECLSVVPASHRAGARRPGQHQNAPFKSFRLFPVCIASRFTQL